MARPGRGHRRAAGFLVGLDRDASRATYGSPRRSRSTRPTAARRRNLAARRPARTIRRRSVALYGKATAGRRRSARIRRALPRSVARAGGATNAVRHREDAWSVPPRSDELQVRQRHHRTWTARTVSSVECFATHKRGFCQHYARRWRSLLREAGIPARIVQGFRPGDPIPRPAWPPRTATPTPGSRCTSRATAGSTSTRPAATVARLATAAGRAAGRPRDVRDRRRAHRRRAAVRSDPRRHPMTWRRRGRYRPERSSPARSSPWPCCSPGRRGHRPRGLAARATRSGQRRRRLRHGHPDGWPASGSPRVRTDRLRVRRRPRRGPAERPARNSRPWPRPGGDRLRRPDPRATA